MFVSDPPSYASNSERLGLGGCSVEALRCACRVRVYPGFRVGSGSDLGRRSVGTRKADV